MRTFTHVTCAFLLASVVGGAFACSSDNATSATGSSSSSSSSSGALPPEETLDPGERYFEGDCDPIAPTQCGFPFPSDVWLVDDANTPTKKHVAFGEKTLPRANGVGYIKASNFVDSDGFSAATPIMIHLPGATIKGLPTQDTIETSITKDSPTIVLDVATGQLVPHFAELDMSQDIDDAERTFMIRPVVRLKDSSRYIVAIRHIVDKDNNAIAPSPVFQALRDGTRYVEEDIAVGRRRGLYKDIFDALAKAGIDHKDLQIAWDFSTASRENNTKALLHMRDDALATVGADGPKYVIDSVEMNPNPDLWKRIHGRMTVPLYLDKPTSGGRLVYGPDGLPKQNGTAEFEFLVHVPNSVMNGVPAALVQNGHGLLGKKTEGQNGYLAEFANLKNYVAFSVDFVGMADDDTSTVIDIIGKDISDFRVLIDRQHQGMLNSLLAMRMMKGGFAKDPEVQFNGKSVIDTTQCYYRGDSQGGIFGTTYMALSTDVTRGLVGEPGMPYSLLLHRSRDFNEFFDILKLAYTKPRDIALGLGLLQMLWDRTEPAGYAPYITSNMLPGTPKHEILIHVAIGDQQVTPLGAHMIARAVGAKNLKPVNRSIWGIEEADAPLTGSGMVEFSFGLPEAEKTNVPPNQPGDKDPHDWVRVLDAAYDQSDVFFRQGVINAFCQGPCDPE